MAGFASLALPTNYSPVSFTNVFNKLRIAFACSLNLCRALGRNLPPNPTQKALLGSCPWRPAGR